ncbi:HAD family hydrolase [Halomonas urumqiensis]|uniref:phosphoglycolate phosphatase n=1 Tax=Halomonas urumqiensis TaxID=1684789 RepID=A0A2N7UCL5_9GAMM|nr:HAD family hydrolase [Halomonas urumqiensis]PMR78131.1 HAD family hydrolase [Halomonas urumqiensis]PTB03281.1 HAD family hydrolase [Halomonas urumqiensis]GHE20558.1 haloacid dehalogenase [Halomonas urumqiensis]
MKHSITTYATLVFDCDGVVLDSNTVKSEAFYQAALPYGDTAAQALVDHHVANGGVSRYMKFAHFLERIVPQHAANCAGPDLETLLENYAGEVRQGLMTCQFAPGLRKLREHTPHARWLIVSGGDQAELREVFAKRGLAELFDGGILGSPDTKDEILARELAHGTIQQPALFLGDSKYDYQAASAAGLDFVFLSGWSEVIDWSSWVKNARLNSVPSIAALLKEREKE